MNIKKGLAVVLLLVMGKASAAVEFPVWQRHYSGTVAGKTVEVDLQNSNGDLQGSYCYAPCNAKKARLSLAGPLQADRITLQEKAADTVTGNWDVTQADDTLKGQWSSPDGKRHYPVMLTRVKAKNEPDIDLVLVADALPEKTGDCGEPPTVTGIKLFQHGKLLQQLTTESHGTCQIYLPEWRDVNFDGNADLMIAQYLPAGPNIPQQTWLYDAGKKIWVDAPAAFQEITSPEIDTQHQQIISFWRSSCCSHGIDVYRWQGNDVVLVDRAESYQQPVLDKGVYLACYVIPDYQDGRIVYPVTRKNGQLSRFAVDKDVCEKLATTERLQTVIQQGNSTEVLPITWVKQADRYCPQVPFVDGNKITNLVVNDEKVENICLSEADHRAMNATAQP